METQPATSVSDQRLREQYAELRSRFSQLAQLKAQVGDEPGQAGKAEAQAADPRESTGATATGLPSSSTGCSVDAAQGSSADTAELLRQLCVKVSEQSKEITALREEIASRRWVGWNNDAGPEPKPGRSTTAEDWELRPRSATRSPTPVSCVSWPGSCPTERGAASYTPPASTAAFGVSTAGNGEGGCVEAGTGGCSAQFGHDSGGGSVDADDCGGDESFQAQVAPPPQPNSGEVPQTSAYWSPLAAAVCQRTPAPSPGGTSVARALPPETAGERLAAALASATGPTFTKGPGTASAPTLCGVSLVAHERSRGGAPTDRDSASPDETPGAGVATQAAPSEPACGDMLATISTAAALSEPACGESIASASASGEPQAHPQSQTPPVVATPVSVTNTAPNSGAATTPVGIGPSPSMPRPCRSAGSGSLQLSATTTSRQATRTPIVLPPRIASCSASPTSTDADRRPMLAAASVPVLGGAAAAISPQVAPSDAAHGRRASVPSVGSKLPSRSVDENTCSSPMPATPVAPTATAPAAVAASPKFGQRIAPVLPPRVVTVRPPGRRATVGTPVGGHFSPTRPCSGVLVAASRAGPPQVTTAGNDAASGAPVRRTINVVRGNVVSSRVGVPSVSATTVAATKTTAEDDQIATSSSPPRGRQQCRSVGSIAEGAMECCKKRQGAASPAVAESPSRSPAAMSVPAPAGNALNGATGFLQPSYAPKSSGRLSPPPTRPRPTVPVLPAHNPGSFVPAHASAAWPRASPTRAAPQAVGHPAAHTLGPTQAQPPQPVPQLQSCQPQLQQPPQGHHYPQLHFAPPWQHQQQQRKQHSPTPQRPIRPSGTSMGSSVQIQMPAGGWQLVAGR